MARVDVISNLPAALDTLAVGRGRPVLVLVGGAGERCRPVAVLAGTGLNGTS